MIGINYIIILLMSMPIINGLPMRFRIGRCDRGPCFQILKNNNWQDFGKFGAVNLGITKPGFEPGEVSLKYNDYMLRFKYLKVLGVNVIRVYALLQPDFYKAIHDWNNENVDHQMYVLHGTAFPELEMEHNNGTDAYDPHVTELMTHFITTTVRGVYGGGQTIYRYDYSNNQKKPVYGDYKYDISDYLLGWVMSGEISPYCIWATNTNKDNLDERFSTKKQFSLYAGQYFSATPQSSRFENWVAEMFDLLAKESMKFGHMSPISHTNWVTTDGRTHPNEPRINTRDFDSVEDWQEFDLHHFSFNWEAGMFFNQHAYPYYPELVKFGTPDKPEIIAKHADPFYQYLQDIRNYYNEYPLIITEFGLPTSVGISSMEREYGRNHGFNTERHQGEAMHQMMLGMINEVGIDGFCVFQLLDEWFKKSWNTLKLDANRARWKNALTSEQYFGIFSVESHPKLEYSTSFAENQYYNLKISNNYEFINIEIDTKQDLSQGELILAIDSMPGGTRYIDKHEFDEKMDSYLVITNSSVQFQIYFENDAFYQNYGAWLRDELLDPSKQFFSIDGEFNDFNMLVKVPTVAFFTDQKCVNGRRNEVPFVKGAEYCLSGAKPSTGLQGPITTYESQVFTVPFLETNDNLALVKREGSKIKIKMPYQMLSFNDPSLHMKSFIRGFGRSFKVEFQEYNNDIRFELLYKNTTEVYNSRLITHFNWANWDNPEYWMIKPKLSFNSFRRAFHKINYGTDSTDLTQAELDNLIYYNKDITDFNIHSYIVLGAAIFLAAIFLLVSVPKIIGKYIAYCYSAKNIKVHSYRLLIYNLLAGSGLLYYIFADIKETFVIPSIIYYGYIGLIMWESILLLTLTIFNKWDLYAPATEEYDTKEHAFVIACHNSSDVMENTIRSLLSRVPGSQIYVADNGSTEAEQAQSRAICESLDKDIHYGHITFESKVGGKIVKRGNKTMAQFAAVSALDPSVKYVTCIDDDTRLHETWNVNKVIKYFKSDERVVVLAYPLTADNPQYDIEWFQAIEYLISGFFKIFHGKIYSTIFNSGAFGTYKVEILKEALLYHNTDYHGDDLQICMNIHQLKGKKYYNDPSRKHKDNYRVATATNMVGTTIVPKCWVHGSAISSHFKSRCDCGNPDLLSQRCKGWFVSAHRFIPRYIKLILNINGIRGLWVRLIALYELVIILNEYFAIFYILFMLKNFGLWILEGFIISYAVTILAMLAFNFKVLRKNKQYIPLEVITTQPLIYKIFMISLYRYIGLFYNLFVYTVKHRSGIMIINRLKDTKFVENINTMYPEVENVDGEVSESNFKKPIHGSEPGNFIEVKIS